MPTFLAITLATLFHLEASSVAQRCDFEKEMSDAMGRLGEGFATVRSDEPAPVTFVLRVTQGTRKSTAHVELLRPDGSLALSRQLSYKASACGPLADAISLIVERYLEDIGWRSSGTGLSPPQPQPTKPPPSDPDPPGEISEETPEQVQRQGLGASLDVHGALDGDRQLWFGPELGAYGRFGMLDVSIYLGGNFWRRDEVSYEGVEKGTVTLFSSYGLAAGGLCWSGPGSLCARAALGLEQVYGHSEGASIENAGWKVVWQMFVRVQALCVFTNEGRLRPFAALSADVRPYRGGFEIEQADKEIRTPLVAGAIALGFRWSIADNKKTSKQ